MLAAISVACDSTASSPSNANASTQPSPSRTDVEPDDSARIGPAKFGSIDSTLIALPGQIIVPSRRDATALPSGLLAVDDLNEDGIGDIIVCVATDPADDKRHARIVAYSGADRSVLWMTEGRLAAPAKVGDAEPDGSDSFIVADGVRSLPDMNADGVPDLFVAGRGKPTGFAVLSGKDGSILGVNATPKDEIDHLVDARDIDGDEKPDLVIAVRIRDEKPNQPADRLGFAVYSGVHYKRVLSFKKPFNRLGVRQVLLFGGFPDTNADGVPEILCYGESAPFRDRPQEGHFALVIGQQFKHSRRTLAGFDPTTTDSFIACPGIVAPDSFPDLVVSTPTNPKMPIQLGRYVLKQQKFEWTLRSDDASAEISKRFGNESVQSIAFGAPIITVPDQDGDGLSDVATICFDSSTAGAAHLMVVSSRSGRILQIETGDQQARIDTDRRRVQLTLLRATNGDATDRIAVTGLVDGTPQPTPAILLFELKGAGASHP